VDITKLYYKTNKLLDQLDLNFINSSDAKHYANAGGHMHIVPKLFKGATLNSYVSTKDYQGTELVIINTIDDEYLMCTDFYGSCSGCDAWEGATNEDILILSKNFITNGFVFRSLSDIFSFLEILENNDLHSDYYELYDIGIADIKAALIENNKEYYVLDTISKGLKDD
jgi:hypothetical protein